VAAFWSSPRSDSVRRKPQPAAPWPAVAIVLTPTPAQPCGQRHKNTQGQPQAASDCFSPKKDGNTADHSHRCSGHRRTPLLERKEHRQSIAFSTSFTPVIPGGCAHRQRQAAKYDEAGESTGNSRQGHVLIVSSSVTAIVTFTVRTGPGETTPVEYRSDLKR
jgi:hypothetical protein